MLELQTLLLLVSEHLCADPATFLPISPKLISFYKRLPKMMLMHLFVSLNLVPFILVIFHCLALNFTPIKDAPVLADSLIVIFFAIIVNTFAVDEQAKLFGQLTISELSIC